jgi:hypothetical protein
MDLDPNVPSDLSFVQQNLQYCDKQCHDFIWSVKCVIVLKLQLHLPTICIVLTTLPEAGLDSRVCRSRPAYRMAFSKVP